MASARFSVERRARRHDEKEGARGMRQEEHADLYLLAALLVCPDDHRMIPGWRAHRQYRCGICRRAVDAELAETVVWERVTVLRPWFVASTTPATDRAACLRAVLARVRLGPIQASFQLTWRSHARSATPPEQASQSRPNARQAHNGGRFRLSPAERTGLPW